jgi:hypothetical protein
MVDETLGTDENDEIRTGVDSLIAFLEGKEKVMLLDAAHALGVKSETVQSWVDFLVEEGVIGIEYKFTKPYIYLNRAQREKVRVSSAKEFTWEVYHTAFLQKAHEKMIPEIEAATLWKNHILGLLEKKRVFFFDEARKRQLNRIDEIWDDYRLEVLMKI